MSTQEAKVDAKDGAEVYHGNWICKPKAMELFRDVCPFLNYVILQIILLF
jgi:hypothetical protein